MEIAPTSLCPGEHPAALGRRRNLRHGLRKLEAAPLPRLPCSVQLYKWDVTARPNGEYLSHQEMDQITRSTRVFARAKPEDKLEIVKSNLVHILALR